MNLPFDYRLSLHNSRSSDLSIGMSDVFVSISCLPVAVVDHTYCRHFEQCNKLLVVISLCRFERSETIFMQFYSADVTCASSLIPDIRIVDVSLVLNILSW